jgi:hypothetical protein
MQRICTWAARHFQNSISFFLSGYSDDDVCRRHHCILYWVLSTGGRSSENSCLISDYSFNFCTRFRFEFDSIKIMPAARKRKVATADEAAPAAEEATEVKSVAKHESGDVKKVTIEACKSWYVANLLTFPEICFR